MAISFNGTSDYINWGDINALDGLTKLTISFWLYHDSGDTFDFSGYIHKYNEGGAGDVGWGIVESGGGGNPADLLIFARNSDFSTATTSAQPLTANAWHHVHYVYDGTVSAFLRLRLWVDGTEQTLSIGGTVPSSLPSTTDPLVFGKNGTSFSKCRIAEAGMWPSVAITDAAIIAGLSSTSTPFSPLFYAALGLGFYADFIGGRTLDRFGNLTTSVVGTSEADHIRIMHPAPPMVSGKQTRGDLMGAMVF